MECDDGAEISSRFYGIREDGALGSLAAGGIAQGDWAGFWQAVIIDLSSAVTTWWDSAGPSASLAIGADAVGARGDIERHIAGHQSARSMARLLGRSPSTVSRELSRNGGYDSYRAALIFPRKSGRG